jgi:hypothetical protein
MGFFTDLLLDVGDDRLSLSGIQKQTRFPIRSPLFREEKLHLESCGPVGRAVWAVYVSEKLRVYIHGQFPEMNDLSDSATYGDCPSFAGLYFPICSNNRRGHEIPLVRQVVVHEGLH